MAGDTLATLGQKLTDLFAGAYAGGNPDISLVFMPFAAVAPADMVQNGVVNVTALGTFLRSYFDSPYLVSPQHNTVQGQDTSYGHASQIYTIAVTLAHAAAAPGSDAEQRVDAEIAMARRAMDSQDMSLDMICEPDDWPLPGNSAYWTIFDSGQSQSQPSPPSSPPDGGTPPPQRIFTSQIWTIKPAIAEAAPVATLEAVHAANPVVASPMIASVVTNHPAIMMAFRPAVMAAPTHQDPVDRRELRMIHRAPVVSPVVRPFPIRPIDQPVLHRPPPPPPPLPPPSSSVAIHFEYMSVTIGYSLAGQPIWNGVFLADKNWYISGMARGGLLPSPSSAAPPPALPLVYGLPTTLILVRNVSIAVTWSGQEHATLGTSGGFLGPFSVSGVTPTIAPDGTWTYARPGMQVVALLCNHLPVLPPMDAPDLAQVTADDGGSDAGTAMADPGSAPTPGAPSSAAANSDPGSGTPT